MEPEFITYQKFEDPALANAAVYYAVKIKSEDFERVNALLQEKENIETNQVEKDYYLFSFTDSELRDVIIKADEWSAFDVVLARKILADRGINISDAEVSSIQEKRIEELKRPEKSQTTWIIIGYVCALAGGVLGIFIGWYLFTGKKTLPDGERVYEYDEYDRQQGRYMFYIGITIAALAFIARIIIGFA